MHNFILIGRATGNFEVSVFLVDDEEGESLHQMVDFSTNENAESLIVESNGGSFSDVFVRAQMKVSTKDGKVIKIEVTIPAGKAKPRFLLSLETKAAYMKILEMKLPEKIPGAFFCAEGTPGLSHLAAMATIHQEIDSDMPCFHIPDDNVAGFGIVLNFLYPAKIEMALPMKLLLPRSYLETLDWFISEYLNSHSKKVLTDWDKTRANNMIKSGKIGELGVMYLQYMLKSGHKYESETLLQILGRKPGGILPHIEHALSSSSKRLLSDPVLDLRPSSAVSDVSDDKEPEDKTSNSGDDKDPDEETSNMNGDDKEPEKETQFLNTQEESSKSQSQPLLSTTQETTTSQKSSQPLLSTTQETTTSQKSSQPLLSTQDPAASQHAVPLLGYGYPPPNPYIGWMQHQQAINLSLQQQSQQVYPTNYYGHAPPMNQYPPPHQHMNYHHPLSQQPFSTSQNDSLGQQSNPMFNMKLVAAPPNQEEKTTFSDTQASSQDQFSTQDQMSQCQPAPKGKQTDQKKRSRRNRKCTFPDCPNKVVQGGLCISHGAKRKICLHPGCTKNVKKLGLCSAHGPARKKCEFEGCVKVAIQGGKCRAHGGLIRGE